MKTSSNFVIVYDFETGGLPSKEKQAFLDVPLVEMAMSCIDMKKLEIIDRVEMIFPYNYKEGLAGYSEEATAVHGITREVQEENAVPLKEIYSTCKKWFVKYKNPRQMCTLAGHNIVGFDNPFLRNFFSYMKDDIDNYVKYYIDTMQFAHMASLEQMDYKLGTCCQAAGIDLVEAHRAQHDVDANAMLFISYVKKLRGEGMEMVQKKERRYREDFQLC